MSGFVVCVVASGLMNCDMKLAGGRVTLIPDPQASAVSVRLGFAAGALRDPEGQRGLSWMALNALVTADDGARRQTLEQIASLGASLSVNASEEIAWIDVKLPPERWEEFTPLLGRLLAAQAPSQTALETLKELHRQACDSLGRDPTRLGLSVMHALLRSSLPVSMSIGSDSAVAALTTQDLQKYQNEFFTRDNYKLGITGPVTESQARALDKQLQLSLPPGNPAPPTATTPAVEGLNVVIVEIPEAEALSLLVGSACLGNVDDTTEVICELTATHHGLAGATSTGLDHLLRVERGVVVDLDASTSRFVARTAAAEWQDEWLRPEQLVISAKLEPVNALHALRIIIKEFTDMVDHGLSQEELNGARRQLQTVYAGERQPPSAEMRRTIAAAISGQKPVNGQSILDGLTTAVVRRRLRRAFDPRHLWIVMVCPNGQQLAEELLSGQISYRYPGDVDYRLLRTLDLEYASFRPYWQAAKVHVLRVSELCR